MKRRYFLKRTAGAGISWMAAASVPAFLEQPASGNPGRVDAHCWVYASRFPPDWDATPVLDTIFQDLASAGFARVELMESILRHDGSVDRLKELIRRYELPVGGCSYYGDFWNKAQQPYLLDDIKTVIDRLHAVGAGMIGLTVGNAGHRKTEAELDTQADGLRQVQAFCQAAGIEPNLHNHTFEVADDMHDLKGTLERLPHFPLGPDLNWLVRGGVDPVAFIETYGRRMVYMHLRDQDKSGKWTEALGEGTTDFAAIAAALKEINYQGRAAVELALDAPATRPIAEDWKISRKYVKTVFNW